MPIRCGTAHNPLYIRRDTPIVCVGNSSRVRPSGLLDLALCVAVLRWKPVIYASTNFRCRGVGR